MLSILFLKPDEYALLWWVWDYFISLMKAVDPLHTKKCTIISPLHII